jgi:tetratricopeptide (TPR) repeat protein
VTTAGRALGQTRRCTSDEAGGAAGVCAAPAAPLARARGLRRCGARVLLVLAVHGLAACAAPTPVAPRSPVPSASAAPTRPVDAPARTTPGATMTEREAAPWRALWNFDDPSASEAAFRAALVEARGAAALELESQIARALGLQRRFDEARATLDAADARAAGLVTRDATEQLRRERALVLLALERGRLARSSGQPADSIVHFRFAFDRARAAELDFLAVDAAHMLGIVEAPGTARTWNARALDLAEASSDPSARGWAAVIANNQGWNEFEAGRLSEALALFERALALRRERPNEREPLWIARWSVARVQRALGRVDDALAEQRALFAERTAVQAPDGYVYEELGECLLALGRAGEARPWFAHANALLSADPWLVANEPRRLERLARLAAGGTP